MMTSHLQKRRDAQDPSNNVQLYIVVYLYIELFVLCVCACGTELCYYIKTGCVTQVDEPPSVDGASYTVVYTAGRKLASTAPYA